MTIALLVAALLAAAAIGLALRSRAPAPVLRAPEAVPRTGAFVGVYVEPDDGRSPVLDEIAAARRSLDLGVYLLSDEATIRALADAAARGVTVRVMLEENPFGGPGTEDAVLAELRRRGVDARWSNPTFRFSHLKMLVADGRVALITNQNLTAAGFDGNREFGLITTRPDEVAAAAAIFAADWERAAEPPPGPLIVSPTNARGRLLALVDGAATSLDVYAEVIRDEAFVAALTAAAARGVAVRIVMSPGDEAQMETLRSLADAGVGVRLLTTPYVHAKVFLVDRRRAFVGSQNLTATSLDQNREIGLIVEEPGVVARIGRVFARDWRAGSEIGS